MAPNRAGAATLVTTTSATSRDRDGLHEQWGNDGGLPLSSPTDHHGGEIMELGRANNGVRDRPGLDEVFLVSLPDVMSVAVDAVDAKDRQKNVVSDAGSFFGFEKVPGRVGEELSCRVVVSNQRVRDVDDGIDVGQRLIDALSSDEVDARRARHHDGLVVRSLQC